MPFGKSKRPLPTRSLRSVRAAVRSTSSAFCLHHAHPFVAAEEKRPVSCREAEGLVTELSSPRFVTYNRVIVSKIWITGYWLRSQLWHVTAANQWTIVEIELLATLGWKRGCQPFSCRCSLNVMHCQKEIYGTCWLVSGIHSRSFFLAMTFNSWKYQSHNPARPSSGSKFELWISDGFEWFFAVNFLYPRFVVLPRSKQLIVMPVTIKLRLGFWGDQPFSCPCSLTVTHCRKEISFTYLFQESMPFGKSKRPLPTRSLRSVRAAVRSTSSAFCLHHAHPFVAAEEKRPVSCREAEGLVTELSSPRFVTYNRVIVSKIWITGYWLRSQLWRVTAANQWTIVEIELLATVGWKRGCQPFSCRCSLNVMHCQKEIYGTCWLVSGIHSRSFFLATTFNSWKYQRVGKG